VDRRQRRDLGRPLNFHSARFAILNFRNSDGWGGYLRFFREHESRPVRQVDSAGLALPVLAKPQQGRGHQPGALQSRRGRYLSRQEKSKTALFDFETLLQFVHQKSGNWNALEALVFRVSGRRGALSGGNHGRLVHDRRGAACDPRRQIQQR
jgi:hypothetical protein